MRGLCLVLSRQDGLILAVQSLNNEIGSEFGIAYAMLRPHALTSRPMLMLLLLIHSFLNHISPF